MRNLADAVGYPCSRTASTQCSDFGNELCESHAETCGGCHTIFCPSCFLVHRAQHSKPARGTSRAKKSIGPDAPCRVFSAIRNSTFQCLNLATLISLSTQ